MSGSFGDVDVPPTLVAFAVGVEKAKNIISAEFKEVGSKLVFLMAERNEDYRRYEGSSGRIDGALSGCNFHYCGHGREENAGVE